MDWLQGLQGGKGWLKEQIPNLKGFVEREIALKVWEPGKGQFVGAFGVKMSYECNVHATIEVVHDISRPLIIIVVVIIIIDWQQKGIF